MNTQFIADLQAAEAMADQELSAKGWEEVETVEEECDDIQSEFDSVWSDRS